MLTNVLQFNHLCQKGTNTRASKLLLDKLKQVILSRTVRNLIGNDNLIVEDNITVKTVTRSNHWKLKVNKFSVEKNSGFCI